MSVPLAEHNCQTTPVPEDRFLKYGFTEEQLITFPEANLERKRQSASS
jgi:hypothetical protein